MADEIKTAPIPEIEPTQEVAQAENTGVVHMDLAVATTEAVSSNPNALPVNAHPNDVTFNVKYGKDYKGEKVMPEGTVVVSKESAAHFESLGIGKIAK